MEVPHLKMPKRSIFKIAIRIKALKSREFHAEHYSIHKVNAYFKLEASKIDFLAFFEFQLIGKQGSKRQNPHFSQNLKS